MGADPGRGRAGPVEPPGDAGRSGSDAARLAQKVEIRFTKDEAVRFISHHDLMRSLQRAVRRAGLPVRMTQGFNPRPRIVVPLALETGASSEDERAEIELHTWMPPEQIHQALGSCLPTGLRLLGVRPLLPRRSPRRALSVSFRLHLAGKGLTPTAEALRQLPAAAALPFLRRNPKEGAPPLARDLRPFLGSATLDAAGDLVLVLKPTAQGIGKPLEYLSLLLQVPVERLRNVRVTKLRLELEEQAAPTAP